ncbi:MAG: YncE family protein [Ignavibacteria bacterium]|nr:YncE family protein [Ignavibacteria bacterium]
MFKAKIYSALLVITLFTFFISGCSEDVVNPPVSSDIDYNAVYVVNGEGNSISVIDISTNQVRRTISLSNVMWPHHINMNPAKTKVAIGIPGVDLSGGHGGHADHEGMFVVLDAKTGSILGTRTLPNINHNAIFSPDGSEIWTAVAHEMGMVYVYNSENLSLKDSVEVGNTPLEVTFSSDGSMAFVANNMSDNVTAIDAMNKTVMATIPVGTMPIGAWTCANNKMYVDNEMGQSISVINVATMTVEETVALGFTPGFAAYNSQMNELWVTNEDAGRVEILHRMNNEWHPKTNVATGNGAHAISFSSDGMTAYVTNQLGGTVSVINVNTRTKTTDITVGTKANGLLIRYPN